MQQRANAIAAKSIGVEQWIGTGKKTSVRGTVVECTARIEGEGRMEAVWDVTLECGTDKVLRKFSITSIRTRR